mmetsp:Transcript_44415/g.96543  ORF Transcript_44415/g.96543 Transcript_44415/m.96543 type:complete len:85 (+) Transcript_44415:1300-1554(+)
MRCAGHLLKGSFQVLCSKSFEKDLRVTAPAAPFTAWPALFGRAFRDDIAPPAQLANATVRETTLISDTLVAGESRSSMFRTRST